MQNFTKNLTNFAHRHPWAVQFALALTIAVIAVSGTSLGGILGVNAATPPFIVDKPAAGDNWTVGESRDIEIKFTQASTKTYVVKFVLCQVSPAICLDAGIIPDMEIPPKSAGSIVKATWSQVGYQANGQPIPGVDSFANNNTIISLFVKDKDDPADLGNDVTSGAFSIVRGIVFTTTTASQGNVRIGELWPVHIIANGPIAWGPKDAEGYAGSIALYLLNGDQQMITAVKKIKPTDFANTGGVVMDHLFGSVNFRLGYPANRDYWFRAIVHYDNSTQGGGTGEFNLYSPKFKIDQAGYTVDFSMPLDNGTTVWPVATTQTIEYKFIPKQGITNPFRMENHLSLQVKKIYPNIGENNLKTLDKDVVIPVGFDTTQVKTFNWSIVKCDLYAFQCSQDPNFKLPSETLWIAADIGSVFSDNDFKSGNFRLSEISEVDLTFDKTKGVDGFVISPLVFNQGEEVKVGVWVKNDGVKDAPSNILRFSLGLGSYELDQLEVNVPVIPAGQSTLVWLAPADSKGTGIKANGTKLYFKLTVDSANVVTETNETNNDYGGEGTIDLATMGAVMHVSGNTANPQYNPSAGVEELSLNGRASSVIWIDQEQFPIDTAIVHGRVTVKYDPAILAPVLDGQDQPQGNTYHNHLVQITNQSVTADGLVLDFTIGTEDLVLPPGGFFGFIVVSWNAIGVGNTEINLKWTEAGRELDGTDLFIDNSNELGDVLRRVETVGHRINVIATPITGLSASYYSAPFNLLNNGGADWSPTGLDKLNVCYNQPTGADVRFAIGFFKADGTNVMANINPKPQGFDGEGYYYPTEFIPVVGGTGCLGANDSAVLNFINDTNPATAYWFTQATQIKFKINMSTPDSEATDQPWVQSVKLDYFADPASQQIGVINYVETMPVTIQPGASAPTQVHFNISPMNGFTGMVQLVIGPIVRLDDPTDPAHITASFVNLPNSQIEIPIGSTDASLIPAIIEFTAGADAVAGLYSFTISGYSVVQGEEWSIPAAAGTLNVGGSGGSGDFTLTVVPATNTAVVAGTAGYTVTVTRTADFTGTITFATNIRDAAQFGTNVTSATFTPATVTFDVSDGSALTKTTTLSVQVATSVDPAILDIAKSFAITGVAGEITKAVTPVPTLTITANGITLNVTIPLEARTKSADLTLPHPVFTVRLYNATNQMSAEVSGFKTDHQNQATILVPRVANGVYRAYARTTRHLWKKATADVTIASNTTTASVNWATTGLPAGNIDANNQINSLDYSSVLQFFAQELNGILSDFDNNGKVNSLDAVFITGMFNGVSKYFLSGDPLPDGSQ